MQQFKSFFIYSIFSIILIYSLNVYSSEPPLQYWTSLFDLGNSEIGKALVKYDDNNYIVVGHSNSPDIGSTSYNYDICVLKVNLQGDTLWARAYGDFSDNEYAANAVKTPDKSTIIVGSKNANLLLMKVDSTGNHTWTKLYGGSGESGTSIIALRDSNYMVLGRTSSIQPRGNWLLKINANGDTLWTTIIPNYFYATSIELTHDNGFIITGYQYKTIGNDRYDDVILLKTDSTGTIEWQQIYDGNYRDEGFHVIETHDRGYIISAIKSERGAFGWANTWIIKTDSIGNMEWDKNIQSNNFNTLIKVIQTNDNGYAFAGRRDGSYGWLLKTNALGDTTWSYKFDSYSEIWDFEQLNDNGYMICGIQDTSDNHFADGDILFSRFYPETLLVNFSADTTLGKLQFYTNFSDLSHNSTTTPINEWQWDFENDGIIDSYDQYPSFTYYDEDTFSVKLIASNGIMTDSLLKENFISTYFDSFPNLYNIKDIPNDQGGWVTVNFARSLYDSDTLIHPDSKAEFYTIESNNDSIWTAVNSTVAYGKSYYSVLVPTIEDSNTNSNGLIDFRIIAGMDEGNFVSNVLTGYSVDNLKPNAPENLEAVLVQDSIASLHWSANKEKDLQYYSIYRSIDGIYFELINESIDTTFVDTIDVVSDSVVYAIKAVDYSGNFSNYSNFVNLVITDITNMDKYVLDFSLLQNYPNPFNPITKVKYYIPKLLIIEISLFNTLGEKVREIYAGIKQKGIHSFNITANGLSSGVYIYQLRSGEFIQNKKCILIK